MPGRQFDGSSLKYRYGFNGQENDNEVKGEGNQQDYGMRIYDSRLGRFLTLDPLMLEAPESSPYSYADNSPIALLDVNGEKGDPGFTIKTSSGNINIKKPLLKNISKLDLEKYIQERVNEIYPRKPKQTKWQQFKSGIKNLSKFTNASSIALQILSYETSGDLLFEKVGNTLYQEFLTAATFLEVQKFDPNNSNFEIITSDPTNLPSWYADEVRRRLINGSASSNDWSYKEELVKRGLLSDRFGENQEYGKTASSKILGKNLERVGQTRLITRHAAHHIVAGNDSRAAGSRQILKQEGIDINDADNGVFLDEFTHNSLHSNEYYRKIEGRLRQAGSGNVRKELNVIRSEIKAGTF